MSSISLMTEIQRIEGITKKPSAYSGVKEKEINVATRENAEKEMMRLSKLLTKM